MEYREGNYPHYENDYGNNYGNNYENDDDNSTDTLGIIGYELYSFMCFLLLFLSICGALMCNRYNNNTNIITGYSRERLIKTKLEKYKRNDKFKEKECAICLDSYMEDEIIIYLECGHYYHNECSKQWFKEGKNCPLCRASLS